MRNLLFLKNNLHYIAIVLCAVVCWDYEPSMEVNGAFWPIIAAVVSAAAQGIGAAVANNKKKKALAKMNRHYNNLIDETEREMNSNFLDRADSQDALRKITDSNTEALRQLNTNAIRQGATDEAKVAMASNLTKRTADAVGELSALGEQHKDKLRGYRNRLKEAKATQNFNAESDVSGMDTIVQGIGQVANAFASTYAGGGSSSGLTQAQNTGKVLNTQMNESLARTQAAKLPELKQTERQRWMEDNVINYGK